MELSGIGVDGVEAKLTLNADCGLPFRLLGLPNTSAAAMEQVTVDEVTACAGQE